MKKKRVNYQKIQTLLSMERTILSKERTVLTEIAVLLGLMTLGFGLIKFFENSYKEITYLGVLFVLGGVFGLLYALNAFKKYSEQIRKIEKKN